MPLLVLQDQAKEDLEYLQNVSPPALAEFCKIAIEFLRRGANPKLFVAAAKKLEVEPDVVQHSVQGLSYLLLESSRQNLNETDFLDSILTLAFPPAINQGLRDMYLQHRKEIRVLLAELSFSLPHYEDLNWRLDIQIASRTLRSQVNPIFLIELETLDPDSKKQLLQTDYVNLKRLCTEIEAALREAKGGHCRRIMRNVK